ncbi:hypothetical protein DPMN_040864 [Dreissena polymorpha]|uniref:Uncharacterized protein n=1 Tax=Dreissena polymorpha TaxID=45954 RepID=A0A9D4HVK8_DREPO|nr:hypothetical protein DPMN_040864 [Dreissena polymorpha]
MATPDSSPARSHQAQRPQACSLDETIQHETGDLEIGRVHEDLAWDCLGNLAWDCLGLVGSIHEDLAWLGIDLAWVTYLGIDLAWDCLGNLAWDCLGLVGSVHEDLAWDCLGNLAWDCLRLVGSVHEDLAWLGIGRVHEDLAWDCLGNLAWDCLGLVGSVHEDLAWDCLGLVGSVHEDLAWLGIGSVHEDLAWLGIGSVHEDLAWSSMIKPVMLTIFHLSWVPTADQINSIKPDQAVGYWSGSVGMSDQGRSGNGSRSTRQLIVHLGLPEIGKMSCGGRKKSRKIELGRVWLGNFGDRDDRVDRIRSGNPPL